MSTDAGRLLEALELIAAGEGKGRYLRAEPGPAHGYRYWATMLEGDYVLGVQSNPKRELPLALLERFSAAGFQIRPNRMEAFMRLGSDFEGAIDRGRATMRAITAELD